MQPERGKTKFESVIQGVNPPGIPGEPSREHICSLAQKVAKWFWSPKGGHVLWDGRDGGFYAKVFHKSGCMFG